MNIIPRWAFPPLARRSSACILLQSFVYAAVRHEQRRHPDYRWLTTGAGNRRRMMKTVAAACVALRRLHAARGSPHAAHPGCCSRCLSRRRRSSNSAAPRCALSVRAFCSRACASYPASVFQALGRGSYSMLVSIARQLLVLVPVAYLLARAQRRPEPDLVELPCCRGRLPSRSRCPALCAHLSADHRQKSQKRAECCLSAPPGERRDSACGRDNGKAQTGSS